MAEEEQVERTLQAGYRRIPAAIISQFGAFSLAEDALQDALVEALTLRTPGGLSTPDRPHFSRA
jgi:predicted RNA polymerase sigma factor